MTILVWVRRLASAIRQSKINARVTGTGLLPLEGELLAGKLKAVEIADD
jgi:hypothetical protein